MDGIRAYWDGKNLLSRNGKVISSAGDDFVKGFPNTPLDGELWMGRDCFETLMGKFMKKDLKGVDYYLFDSPTASGNYENRMNLLKQLSLPSHVHITQFQRCQNTNQLREYLDEINSLKGEGLIAVDPESSYTIGRTSSLLKIKVKMDL